MIKPSISFFNSLLILGIYFMYNIRIYKNNSYMALYGPIEELNFIRIRSYDLFYIGFNTFKDLTQNFNFYEISRFTDTFKYFKFVLILVILAINLKIIKKFKAQYFA